MPASSIVCFFVNLVWGFFANDGGLIIPESTTSQKLLDMASYYLPTLEKGGVVIVFRSGNSNYTVSRELISEFLYETLSCVFRSERVHPVDGDYLKHGIQYVRFMLL